VYQRKAVCSDPTGPSGDFPVQLATRLPDWSAGGLLRCSDWCPFVRVSCRPPNSTSPRCTTCCGHHREDPRSNTAAFLVTSSWHLREDVTRMLLGCYKETASVEF